VRIIAGLRDLGDATFLLWTITSRLHDPIPRETCEFAEFQAIIQTD